MAEGAISADLAGGGVPCLIFRSSSGRRSRRWAEAMASLASHVLPEPEARSR